MHRHRNQTESISGPRNVPATSDLEGFPCLSRHPNAEDSQGSRADTKEDPGIPMGLISNR
jgi:hypothetical protein